MGTKCNHDQLFMWLQ